MSLWTDLLGGAQAVSAAGATHTVTTTVAASGKIVVIFGGTGSPASVSVADSASNTYSLVAQQLTSQRWLAMFYADGSLPSGGTITCTVPSSIGTWLAACYSKTGLAAGAADATGNRNQVAGNQPSQAVTTTVAGDIMLGASHVSGAETFTADWSALGYASLSTTHAIFTEEETAGAAGSVTYAPTMSDTTNAVATVVAAFKVGASPQTLSLGHVATGAAVRGPTLAASGAAHQTIGHVASAAAPHGVSLRGVAVQLSVGHVSSSPATFGPAIHGTGAAHLTVGHVSSSAAVHGVTLHSSPVTLAVGKVTRTIAFADRRGLSYMKRNSGLAAGSDSTNDATITAPWISGVSLYLRWLQFEATRGTFTWDNVGASALEAKTNGRLLNLRISCGNDAPAHVYSDFAGPNGGVTKVTLNSGAYVQPAVWEQAWRNEYVRLYTAVNALLATPLTDGSGETIGDYCLGVTIGSASQDNPEMASCTQYKAAGNAAAIASALNATTAAMDGLSGKGGQATYSARLIQLLADQWEWGIKWHMANVSACPSVLAFGTIGVRNDSDTGTTSDSDVNQQAFAGRYFGGPNAGKIVGLVTNYSPTVSGTGSTAAQPGGPYYQNRSNGEHVSIDICRQVGGAYAFQFDVSPMNAMTDPTTGGSLALMLYGGATLAGDGLFYRGNVPSYYDDVRFVEVGPGLFGKNDTELQNSITALRRTPGTDVRGISLAAGAAQLTLGLGHVSSSAVPHGPTLRGAGAATLSIGHVASSQATRGARISGTGSAVLGLGHVPTSATARGTDVVASGAAMLAVGHVPTSAVAHGANVLSDAGRLLIGHVASGAAVRGVGLAGTGSTTALLGKVASGEAVRGADLVPAPVTLAVGHVAGASVARGVGLTPAGAATLSVGQVGGSAAARGVSLTPGPVALAVGKVSRSATVHGVSLAAAGTAPLLPGHVPSGAVAHGADVVSDAGRLFVGKVTSGAAPRGVTLAGVGAAALLVGAVTATANAHGANLSGSGAIALPIGKAPSGATPFGVTMHPAPVPLPLGHIASTAAAYGPELAVGVLVALGHIASQQAVRGADLTPGAALLLLHAVASTATVHGADLAGAGVASLGLATVPSSAAVFGLLVTTLGHPGTVLLAAVAAGATLTTAVALATLSAQTPTATLEANT